MGRRERRFEGLACWRNKVRSVSLLEKMSHELQGKDLRELSLQKGSEGTGGGNMGLFIIFSTYFSSY